MLRKLIHCIFYDRNKIQLVILYKLSRFFSDKFFVRNLFKLRMGYTLNLDNPQTFSEKIQWLKLYNRKPEYTKMVDKYEAKKYVASVIGEEYIIPTLGVWNKFEDIDFEKLPNQFVLKCTHDSGGLVICKDKQSLNIDLVRKKINKSLKKNYFWENREWPYKNVHPRIIAEQYMKQQGEKELIDYKFFCFNGSPLYCQVIKDRNTNETIDFYDRNWIRQNFLGLLNPRRPQATHAHIEQKKPRNFKEMLDIAHKLSQDIPFLRVDLYEINDKVYWGELTFYPYSGCGIFTPLIWNKKLGDMITLPQ